MPFPAATAIVLRGVSKRVVATQTATASATGAADEVDPPHLSENDAAQFTGFYRREVVPRAGHFFPREAPDKVVDAVLELIARTR